MLRAQKDVVYTLKVILIGPGGVGKTCLFNRYCFNSFNFNTEMTVGVNFHSTYMHLKERSSPPKSSNEKYVVNSIFDFGGQERFKPLIPKFVKGANGALLVFDSVSYASFNKLNYWYNLLTENIRDINIPKILVGAKSDLLAESPEGEIVSREAINRFIEKKNLNGFFRTSALENYNVIEVFKELNRLMLQHNKVEKYTV
ncbi:MAG: Small GTP-binding domain protein [Promethearchaeota archaeon]|nr:MAG: Small GTP-binding domain protein [Candidatus Lokiarchaeota archaeon]